MWATVAAAAGGAATAERDEKAGATATSRGLHVSLHRCSSREISGRRAAGCCGRFGTAIGPAHTGAEAAAGAAAAPGNAADDEGRGEGTKGQGGWGTDAK